MGNKIEVEAEVLQFFVDDMHDSFDDGGSASYDATELCLLSPENLRGRKLTIYHEDDIPENSPWRAVGQHVLFTISEEDITEMDIIFSGTASNLQTESRE